MTNDQRLEMLRLVYDTIEKEGLTNIKAYHLANNQISDIAIRYWDDSAFDLGIVHGLLMAIDLFSGVMRIEDAQGGLR